MNARPSRRPKIKGKPGRNPKFRGGGGDAGAGTGDKPWWSICGFVLIYLPLVTLAGIAAGVIVLRA